MEYHQKRSIPNNCKKNRLRNERIGFNYSITSGYDVVVGTHYICFSTTSIVDLLEKTGRKKKHFCVCVSFAGRPEPCHAMSLQNPRLRHYRSNRQTRYTLMTVLFSFLKLVFSQFYYTYI